MTVIMYCVRAHVSTQLRGETKDGERTLGVSNFQRAMSMVIPRSRSALSLSRTHAYLNEPGRRERGERGQSRWSLATELHVTPSGPRDEAGDGAECSRARKIRRAGPRLTLAELSGLLLAVGREREGQLGVRAGWEAENDFRRTTSRWYACRYRRTCRSSVRWWSTCRSRRGLRGRTGRGQLDVLLLARLASTTLNVPITTTLTCPFSLPIYPPRVHSTVQESRGGRTRTKSVTARSGDAVQATRGGVRRPRVSWESVRTLNASVGVRCEG